MTGSLATGIGIAAIAVLVFMLVFNRLCRPWFHWANENDDERGRPRGRGFKHGRAWMHARRPEGLSATIEWSFGLKGLQLKLDLEEVGNDDWFTASVGALFFCVYFSLQLPFGWLRSFHPRESRTIGVSIHWPMARLSLWERQMSWSRSDPKWWYLSVDLEDLLKGRAEYSTVTLETADVIIPMPEKGYKATVAIEQASWKRPRWPTRTMYRAQVDIPGGIPKPGKGTESYNCDEDATFGLSCEASSVNEAIVSVVDNVLRDRQRYGGRNWVPEKKRKAG
jgi:hypothetical protein